MIYIGNSDAKYGVLTVRPETLAENVTSITYFNCIRGFRHCGCRGASLDLRFGSYDALFEGHCTQRNKLSCDFIVLCYDVATILASMGVSDGESLPTSIASRR